MDERPIAMIWMHELRGGYGYVEEIPVLMIKRTKYPRVSVLVMRKTGEIVQRSVTSDRLRFVNSDEEMEQCKPEFDALAEHWAAKQRTTATK